MTNKILLPLLAIIIVGCGKGPGDEATSSGSGGGGSTSSTNAFSISGSTANAAYVYTRKSTGFANACEILSTASSQSIDCYIDVNEGDLYHQGLQLDYSIPAGMCMYLGYEPYWYYNQDLGYGPDAISINVTKDAAGVVTASSCSFEGGALVNCQTGNAEVSIDPDDLATQCIYDRSDTGAKNCCLGDYTFISHIDNNGTITDATTLLDWGGDAKDCIGGTARANSGWTNFSRRGFPVASEDLINREAATGRLVIRAPLSYPNSGSNIPASNFYTAALHNHTAYASATTSTLPFFVDPIDDVSGTLLPTGNPAYTFNCLSESYEITYQINVYVREWDVYSDFLAYLTSSGVTSTPDRRGTSEGTTCTGVGSYCNDEIDADDFVSTLVTYSNSTPAQRRANFPFDDYSSF